MASITLLNKLDSLNRCLTRLRDKTPDSCEQLSSDYDLQDIITLNLERAVQSCVDIASHLIAQSNDTPPATMSESFERLDMLGIVSSQTADNLKKAVGFRNIAVHQYQKIDWEIVYNIVTQRLDDFVAFAKQVKVWADRHES